MPWLLSAGVSVWLLATAFFSRRIEAAPSVNVALEASFSSPPYLLELLETAAQENSSSYFPLLDRIAEGYFTEYSTEKDLYEAFLEALSSDGHLAAADALSSFKLALSLHVAAPRIQAHYQYYNTSVESLLMVAQDAACPVWVHFNGKQYCSPTLERAQQDFKGPGTNDLPFDHVLSLHPELPVSTLYVDINSPLFSHFHRTLSETARTGRTSYRVRYRPSLSDAGKPLSVSGYGVELALKRTDYIVIDDRDAVEKQDTLDQPAADGAVQTEDLADLKPLSTSELLGLGLKTSRYILSSNDTFGTLLKVSQDFLKYSSFISRLNASDDFYDEHAANREIFLSAGFNVVWVNGLQVDVRQMDAFALLERLRYERRLINNLKSTGLSASESISLISHSSVTQSKGADFVQRYDYRDEQEGGRIIIWLNNIEKDSRYSDWPTESSALLQRMFPGQLPAIRRDIHNLVIPLDLSRLGDVDIAVETLQALVQRKIPARFGIVPLVSSLEAEVQAKIVYYLWDVYGIGSALSYLTECSQNRNAKSFNKASFDAAAQGREPRKGKITLESAVILGNPGYRDRVANAKAYIQRLDAGGSSPRVFVNGVVLPRNDEWLQTMSNRISSDLQILQWMIYNGAISEDAWFAGQFLQDALTHRNALIIPEDEDDVKILDLSRIIPDYNDLYNAVPMISHDTEALKQFWAHLIVVADLDSEQGSQLLLAALEFRKGEQGVQVDVIHNPNVTATSNFKSAKLFHVQSEGRTLEPQDLLSVLDDNVPMGIINPHQNDEMAESFWLRMQPLIASLGLKPGENGVIVNGRLVGPLPRQDAFSLGDFELLLKYERLKRITPVNTALAALDLEDRLDFPLAAAKISSLVALSAMPGISEGVFENKASIRMDKFKGWKADHTAIMTGDPKTASVHIVASLDPTSETAQRLIPILKVLSDLSGIHLKLFLNPRERIEELPIKRFYRYVLQSKPLFGEDGSVLHIEAKFEGLPRDALLNLGLDVPPAWLVSPKNSVQDPDNIKLSALKSDDDINAIYELEHILIEGHSRDVTTGQPPRGAQLVLGTEQNHYFADTLVMANLGYFQFKANPGYWHIGLKSGRSQEVFNIDSIGALGYGVRSGDQTTEMALMSFQGKTLFPRLSRKPGQETEDVLEDGPRAGSAQDYIAKAMRFGQSILSGVGVTTKSEHADINIFSVASGHLYERMLNIMMVSVMKHTKHTVKFWFIAQFLSPSFKSTLPVLAATYKFEYEMVTYKWPHWLRAQKEKQREIWGYKILFLDVLFPLSLDKVIFVDADQIVRTDMYDLVTHDLHGAPYGFTPMCDSRTEMEGFRFWKQGYWKNYLRGLPYHISALYVVDLKMFRQIAAGDRLRQQYHQLSADPGSLSNLDQDLPNHMQMTLPIHSLPQEWLWCETWCSDESLKEARTIDLCNNPQTKEPKLDRARRQVPEWTVYDDEITEVFRKAKEREGEEIQLAEGARVQEELDQAAEGSKAKDKEEL